MADETAIDETASTEASAEAPEEAAEEAPQTDELHQGLLDRLSAALGDAIVDSHIVPGDALWVRVAREAWVDAAEAAKGRLGCTFFDFLSAIDWMPSPWGRYEDAAGVDSAIPTSDPAATPIETGYAGGESRFQVICRVADIRRHHGVILKADLPDDDLRIGSLVPLYAGANWHERECWEMFGVAFDGHPSLRHLYLPSEFEGHPLRKDYPLLARTVKPWPGLVDVEAMPGDAPTAENGEGTGAADASADAAQSADADKSDGAEADQGDQS
jgi:NADH-quinone oxidoreductase subunit C